MKLWIRGAGAVSPAGWSASDLLAALKRNEPLPMTEVERPGWSSPLLSLRVPAPVSRPAFASHPRMRRASPISRYAAGAALEAIGPERLERIQSGKLKLGAVFSVMTGGVRYSRKFYEETLNDPVTASPLLFPETVFNAPASHLAALIGSDAVTYTLVGDSANFLVALALAAHWLETGEVDACVVAAAEEGDWLIADAVRLFSRRAPSSEGAGALFLTAEPPSESDAAPGVLLDGVTESRLYSSQKSRAAAVREMARELSESGSGDLLCDSRCGIPSRDRAETLAWEGWQGRRLSPKSVLGEGLAAGAAWQCVVAAGLLARGDCESVLISVAGTDQQAIGARFIRAAAAKGGS